MYYVRTPPPHNQISYMHDFFQRIEKEVKKEMSMYWAIGKMDRSYLNCIMP